MKNVLLSGHVSLGRKERVTNVIDCRSHRAYWKAQFLTDLTDDPIRALVAGFERCPSPMSAIILEHFHGAASRVPYVMTTGAVCGLITLSEDAARFIVY